MKQLSSSSTISSDLISYLESLSDQEWKITVTKAWDVRAVVAHLVGWLEVVAKTLPEAWKTKKMPWFMKTDAYDEFNKQNVEKFRDFKPSKLISQYKKHDKKISKLIEEIGYDHLKTDGNFGWVLDDDEDSHELHHFNQIKGAVAKHKS